MIKVLREQTNPIIRPDDISPISEDFEVIGVFNPGVTIFEEKTLLLLRIAERPKDRHDGFLRIPYFEEESGAVKIREFDKSDDQIDYSDCRVILDGNGNRYLTSFSSFLVATSSDGVHFEMDQSKRIMSANMYESYGIEDARITYIEGKYLIQYTAASKFGICAALRETTDFLSFSAPVIIMPPDNKDISIFPEKINGEYYILHRPSTSEFADPNMWIARSKDLTSWGDHRLLMSVCRGMWDERRIGAGCVPIKTEQGWLIIYHGANNDNVYCCGVALLDLTDPYKVIARSEEPFMTPTAECEKNGFFGNVIFPCGGTQMGDDIRIYYGAADKYVCMATVNINELMKFFGREAA